MQKTIIAVVLAGMVAAPAFAEEAPVHSVTANVGAVTDYVFRGISQSQHNPSVQGGVDYAHSSGLYVGVWGSTVKWVDRPGYQIQKDNNIELDLYGGYKGAVGDFGYDVGVIRYFYPGDFNPASGATANTSEVYVGGSWKFVSLKYNHVVSDSIFNWVGISSPKTKGSGYTDLTVTYPINETVNVIAHVGRQTIKNLSSASYTDYKLGVTKDLGFGVVGLAYTDTNAKYDAVQRDINYNWSGKDVGKGVLAASFVKNF